MSGKAQKELRKVARRALDAAKMPDAAELTKEISACRGRLAQAQQQFAQANLIGQQAQAMIIGESRLLAFLEERLSKGGDKQDGASAVEPAE